MNIYIYLFPLFIFSQDVQLNKLFERSVYNNLSCDSLINYCSNERNLEQQAYLGAAMVLEARYSKSYFSKISLFKNGSRKLDDAINKKPKFVQFRWLRYCLQKNAPKFLKYNKNLTEDSLFINQYGTNQQKRVLNE
tara:strand:+ start:93 stop:500 length:408 start_codon:yes stop_codon:yes gene_type:complete